MLAIRRMMAHRATERALTQEEISVIASALADYQNSSMAEAKATLTGRPTLYAKAARERAASIWERRSHIAHDLHNEMLPVEGSVTVVIRR